MHLNNESEADYYTTRNIPGRRFKSIYALIEHVIDNGINPHWTIWKNDKPMPYDVIDFIVGSGFEDLARKPEQINVSQTGSI